MAEALGLASSIVALVQLSASLYSVTSKFYREAKDAKSKISALATQIRNLSGVLQNLSLMANSPLFDDAGVIPSPEFRDTYIGSCHTTLQKIKRTLEKAERDIESGSHRKLVTRSLKWPFAAQETNDLIAELGQHRDNLQLALSADTMSQLLQCLTITKGIAESIERIDQKLERKASIDMRAELTKKREDIVQFFLKVNPQSHLQDCRSRRQPNTGRWLIERNETFRDWFNSPGSNIWLSGIPGAGKTILCGTVIEELLQKQTTSTALAFFFCDYNDTKSQEPVNVLGAIAVQLAKQANEAFELLESYYEELHPEDGIAKPSETKGMIEVIRSMINEYDSVYLAVDGLDECGSKAVEVTQSLKELAQGDQVTMAVFSRNEPDVADELSDSLRIEIAAHTEDLELYVLAQMENRKRLGSLAVRNAELHDHILRTLIQGANGMFRWVACQLDYLDGLPSDGRRRKALTELPPTLYETYDRILDRIMQGDEHSQELCRKALHWIGLGYGDVTPRALCEAISIPDDQDTMDQELLVEPDWVSRSCSSLVRIVGEGSEFPHFQLAHFSVKEYLRSIKSQSNRGPFRFAENEAIQKLLQTSLRFLTFPMFDQAPTLASSEIQRMAHRNKQHPFYSVAASYSHFICGDVHSGAVAGDELAIVLNDETMIKYAMKLFNPDKTPFFLHWALQAIWGLSWTNRDEKTFSELIGLVVAPEFSTLHFAATFALPSICTYLIEIRKVDINKRCRLGTPLHFLLAGASIYNPNHLTSVEYNRNLHRRKWSESKAKAYDLGKKCLEIFVQHGADTSAQYGGANVFQMAINNATPAQTLWIEPLITQSTTIDQACIDDFKAAVAAGNVDQAFSDAIWTAGSNADAPPMWSRLASVIQTSRMKERGCEEQERPVVKKILSDEDFPDAVRISLDQKLTDTLKLLVQDPRFRTDLYIPTYHDGVSQPMVHFAIRAGSPKLLELLFEAGCDPKVVDETDGWTTLHQCAWWNKYDAANAELLLRSGVVDSITNKVGETCWHIAAEEGNVLVLQALIELGSDTAGSLRTTSKKGRTPLASAVLEGQNAAALLLLHHCGADVEVFRSDKSILDAAVATGSDDLFPRLHAKMKEAGAEEALLVFKPLGNINMACSPKLLDYLLSTWATQNKTKSDALATYLLDANNPKFDNPDRYPRRADLHHIITQLSPSVGAMDDPNSPFDFWNIFCDEVVVTLTRSCNHKDNQCRNGLIKMIFEVLIEAGVLSSHEPNARLPSYRKLFQSLFDRGEDLKCSWITSSIELTIESSTLSDKLATDAASNKLLSLAVQQSNIDVVKQLLHYGVDVHASHKGLSPIEQACFSSDLPTFELVIGHADDAHINRAGSQGKTLLHWSVSGTVPEYLLKIQPLLKLGADIDTKVDDANGDTALTLASRSEREDIVTLLVSEGANPLHRARDGWSILHTAALTGNLRYIRFLNRSHVPELFWRGTCEYPLGRYSPSTNITHNVAAIHLAAANGRSNFLRFIAHNNFPLDVNAVTGFPTMTPLDLASFFGHLDVVEFLLSAKVNVNARDAYGQLPLDGAAWAGHLPIVKALLNSGSEPPSNSSSTSISLLMSRITESAEDSGDPQAMSRFNFEQAIMNGHLDRCKDMAKRGQSINMKLPTPSYTPLVCALVQSKTAIVDWLVSSAVEVTNLVISSLHPSMRCIASLATHYMPSPKTLSALLSLALRQNVSWYGSILGPLHVAILDNEMEALEAILNHIHKNDHAYRRMIDTELICVPADITNWRGRTALSILVSSFNREEALSNDPPWTQMLPPGSPLHWAIRKSDVHAVRLLLRHEADVNQADSWGMTPLRLAVSSDHPAELVQELIQAGAGLAESSRNRINAMQAAIRNGDLELVKSLAEINPETLKAMDEHVATTMLENAGSADVFQYLVSQGADPFYEKEIGLSAVTRLMGPRYRLRAFIMNSGLSIQSSQKSLAFPIINLAFKGGAESIRMASMLLRSLPDGVATRIVNWEFRGIASPMCTAASANEAEMVEALINMGAELDSEGCRHGSPLMAACAWGNLDAARCLVRAGALLRYVNGDGLLRSAINSASRYQKIVKWLLVERHTEQPKIDYEPSQSTTHNAGWSGPRLFKLALPAYMHRDFDESRWSHLQRLQKWREGLRGSALAESRKDSGLDFGAELEAESRQRDVQAARDQFLASLGEL